MKMEIKQGAVMKGNKGIWFREKPSLNKWPECQEGSRERTLQREGMVNGKVLR